MILSAQKVIVKMKAVLSSEEWSDDLLNETSPKFKELETKFVKEVRQER